jgi:hypothetical protein
MASARAAIRLSIVVVVIVCCLVAVVSCMLVLYQVVVGLSTPIGDNSETFG